MNSIPVFVWAGLACLLLLPLSAFLRRQLRTVAVAVAEWFAYCCGLVAAELQAAADNTGRAVAAARHGISKGGWPVWPLIAAIIAVTGAFLFVRSEYYLVSLTAKAIFAPDQYDATRGVIPASGPELEMAESVAWVFVGGTLVLGGLPFVLADRNSHRVGPLDQQPRSVKRAVTGAVYVLSVVAVVGSVVLGCYRAYLTTSGNEAATGMDSVAAYVAGGATAAITSVGSLAVGWAVDYALMGVWLLLVALVHVALRLALLPARMVTDLAHRNASVLTPTTVDAMARLGGAGASRRRRSGTGVRADDEDPAGQAGERPEESVSGDVDAPVMVVPPGSTFAGRWQVVGNLPNADTPGYAAAVLLCRDLRQTGTPASFVIKLLSKEGRNAKEWRRELEAAEKVRSDWAVNVLDSGATGKWLWTVTPHYVPGSLAVYGRGVVRTRPLDWCLVMVDQLLWGLDAVHGQNIAHLDIKPQNVLLSWEDDEQRNLRPALADFGLAKQFSQANSTQSDRPRGTPFYMSYEQMTVTKFRDDRSPLSDIYAMGSLLYWLISGKPALSREANALSEDPDMMHIAELMKRNHRPARLDELVTGLPKNVADLADQWLSYDPHQRLTEHDEVTPAKNALFMLRQVTQELMRDDPHALAMPVGPDIALSGLPRGAEESLSDEAGTETESE
ncbi:protein kinase domain-containing protein [Streptomyces massasporeus]|uniref:protein kinase domain-containing protein n=1 Tax=Streptomyces massasporeus TaxID=67324 RepID=UPI003651E948